MSRVSLKGVVAGGVVDIVATNLVALPVLVVAAAQANVAQLPKEEQGRAMLAAVNASPALFAVQLLLGSLCSVLGGYVAGLGARRNSRQATAALPAAAA